MGTSATMLFEKVISLIPFVVTALPWSYQQVI